MYLLCEDEMIINNTMEELALKQDYLRWLDSDNSTGTNFFLIWNQSKAQNFSLRQPVKYRKNDGKPVIGSSGKKKKEISPRSVLSTTRS